MANKKSRLEQAAAEQAAAAVAATAEATKIFFSGADDGTSEAAKAKTMRSKAKAVEPVRDIIFSVRAGADAVAEWKSYAKAKDGASMTSVVAAAMTEYIKRHPLTDQELEMYKREMYKQEILREL